jgi:hypothetical protein
MRVDYEQSRSGRGGGEPAARHARAGIQRAAGRLGQSGARPSGARHGRRRAAMTGGVPLAVLAHAPAGAPVQRRQLSSLVGQVVARHQPNPGELPVQRPLPLHGCHLPRVGRTGRRAGKRAQAWASGRTGVRGAQAADGKGRQGGGQGEECRRARRRGRADGRADGRTGGGRGSRQKRAHRACQGTRGDRRLPVPACPPAPRPLPSHIDWRAGTARRGRRVGGRQGVGASAPA